MADRIGLFGFGGALVPALICLLLLSPLAACGGSSQRTRVTRTNGTHVVGTLVDTRADAIILRVDGQDVRIPLGEVASIRREGDATPPGPAIPPGPAPTPQQAQGGDAPRTETVTPPASAPKSPVYRAPAGAVPAVVLPAGTRLPLVIRTAIGSATSRNADRVEAALASPVVLGGAQALPGGAPVSGVVVEAVAGERADGRGRVAVRFDRLSVNGADVPLSAAPIRLEATARPRRRGIGGVFEKVVRKTKGAFGIESAGGNIGLGAGSRVVIELSQPVTLGSTAKR